MPAEAPAGWRPFAARPGPEPPGHCHAQQVKGGQCGSRFPRFGRVHPQFYTPATPSLLGTLGRQRPPVPRPPSPGAGKNSAPRPLPLWGARVPQSPGAASGHDAGANWRKSEPVVGLGAPVPAALDPGSGGSVSPCGQTTQKAARRVFTTGT